MYNDTQPESSGTMDMHDVVSDYNATAAAKPDKHINRAGVY